MSDRMGINRMSILRHSLCSCSGVSWGGGGRADSPPKSATEVKSVVGDSFSSDIAKAGRIDLADPAFWHKYLWTGSDEPLEADDVRLNCRHYFGTCGVGVMSKARTGLLRLERLCESVKLFSYDVSAIAGTGPWHWQLTWLLEHMDNSFFRTKYICMLWETTRLLCLST